MNELVPAGYYTSNTKDCDIFLVKGTSREGQKFYFRKDSIRYSVGADIKWSVTNKATFDHCITVTNSASVEVGDSGGLVYSDKDGRGFYISASAHYGVTADVKTQWAYHDVNHDTVSVWGAVSDGAGGNVRGCAGVWYDKEGDLHVKFGVGGIIPECPAFGVSAVISRETLHEILTTPSAVEGEVSSQASEGESTLKRWVDGVL